MADDNNTRWTFDLDATDALGQLTNLKGTIESIGKDGGKNISGLINALTSMGEVLGVVAVAGLALKTALDWTKEGEALDQVNNQFDLLTQNAGISTTELSEGLRKAGKGLIDDNDLLKLANKALVELGANAKKTPELLTMALKMTSVMGGTAQENFEKLTMAIATGNMRLLKSAGIIINTNQAYIDFAKSINTTVNALTDSEKQQALLNAVLDQGNKSLRGVKAGAGEVTSAMTVFLNTLKDIRDIFVLVFEHTIGPVLSKVFGGLNSQLHSIKLSMEETFGSTIEKSEAHVEKMTSRIEMYKKAIADAQDYIDRYHKGELTFWEKITSGSAAGGTVEDRARAIEEYKKQIASLEVQINKTNQAMSAGGKGPNQAAIEAQAEEAALRKQKRDQAEVAFQKDLMNLSNQRLQSDIANEDTLDAVKKDMAAQRQQLMDDEFTKESELEEKRINGILTEQQYLDLVEQMRAENENKIAALEDEEDQRRLKALDNYAQHANTIGQGVAATWHKHLEQSTQDFNNMSKHGEIMFSAFKKNSVNAFKAIGDGSKTASEAMRDFFWGAVADMAESEGEMLIEMGIAGLNPIYFAAGGALIALSSYLRSQSSGSKGVSSGGGGGGGGGYSSDMGTTSTQAQAQEKKSVTVNVNGDFLNTEQTQTRLMELIRQSTDATDFNYNKIGG